MGKEELNMNPAQSPKRILQESLDAAELETAATSLAGSSDDEDLRFLERFLRDQNFLRRLDPSKHQDAETDKYRNVLLAVGRNSLPQASNMLLTMAQDKNVVAEPDRVDILLEASAALRPLPENRVQIFRMFGDKRYFLLNLNVLVNNGSLAALEEVRREILSKPQDVEDDSIVSLMHRSFVPHRTDELLIKMAEDLVAKGISHTITVGLFESFFDYQGRRWFGPIRMPPKPASLDQASTKALHELLKLIALSKQASLPAELGKKIDESFSKIKSILAIRPSVM